MPLLNYQQRFAPLVEAGIKMQTIRAMRKYPFAEGDRLYHYTGLRTKNTRKLGESTASIVSDVRVRNRTIIIDGQVIYRASAERLAIADGFKSLADFLAFFPDGFHGQIITWTNFEPLSPTET